MAQVAFDTHEFIETLETAGLPIEQAKAISLAVRKSHEVADVATKRDLDDLRKDIGVKFEKTDAQIAEVRKDMQIQFEKTDAQIAEVRKDMQIQFEKTGFQIVEVRKDLTTQITDVRKDLEAKIDKLGLQITVRLGGMLAIAIGVMTAIFKVL